MCIFVSVCVCVRRRSWWIAIANIRTTDTHWPHNPASYIFHSTQIVYIIFIFALQCVSIWISVSLCSKYPKQIYAIIPISVWSFSSPPQHKHTLPLKVFACVCVCKTDWTNTFRIQLFGKAEEMWTFCLLFSPVKMECLLLSPLPFLRLYTIYTCICFAYILHSKSLWLVCRHNRFSIFSVRTPHLLWRSVTFYVHCTTILKVEMKKKLTK